MSSSPLRAMTPPMGWNSWNKFRTKIDDLDGYVAVMPMAVMRDFLAAPSAVTTSSLTTIPPGGSILSRRDPTFTLGPTSVASGLSPFAPGCWYHVVGTYDGTEQRLFEQRYVCLAAGDHPTEGSTLAMAEGLGRRAVDELRRVTPEDVISRYEASRAK